MTTDQKIEEILQLVRDERVLNNARFSQISSGIFSLQQDVMVLKSDVKEVKQEVNHVYMSLSQDIQVFAEDLHKVKKRVDRIEKKIA